MNTFKENKKTYFLFILGVFVLTLAGHNFARYYLKRDYVLQVFTQCDPGKYSCFEVDPAVSDLVFQTKPYKKVQIVAKHAPSCLDEHDCQEFYCTKDDDTCQITYCSQDTIEGSEKCIEYK